MPVTTTTAKAPSRRPVLAWAYALLAVTCVAVAGYMAWQPSGAGPVNWVDDIGEAITSLAAAVSCGLAARRLRGSGTSASWVLLAAGTGAWSAGQLLTCWYELLRGVDTPFPGLADIGFLAFPPLAIIALQRLARNGAGYRWYRSILDGLILVCALLVIGWDTALGQVWSTRSGGLLATGVSLAYPATDVVLAAAAFLSIGRAPRHNRSALRSLAAGMVAMAVADSGYSYLMTLASSGRWQAIDASWLLAFGIMALAACSARGARPGERVATTASEQSWLEILTPYVPLLSALGLLLARAMTSGRIDRVTCGAGAAALVLIFARQLLVLADNKALVRAVQHQAFHDPLTGLANRALFNDRLEHAAELHRAGRRSFAVLFLDLDDFKSVNDSLGHPVGDQLLVLLAERLRVSLGPADTVARLGGDEFAVLLEDADAIAVSLQLLMTMETPFQPYGSTVAASMSIGVVLSDEADLEPFEYLRRADLALYAAKASGKNTYHVYGPTLDIPQQSRRAALERHPTA